MAEPVIFDRREIREHLEKTQHFWAARAKGEVSTGGIADSVIQLLVSKGIQVIDSDWS